MAMTDHDATTTTIIKQRCALEILNRIRRGADLLS
jgi:hypothetical protein